MREQDPDRPEIRVGEVLFPKEYSTTEDLPPRPLPSKGPPDPDLLVLSKRQLVIALVVGMTLGLILALLCLVVLLTQSR